MPTMRSPQRAQVRWLRRAESARFWRCAARDNPLSHRKGGPREAQDKVHPPDHGGTEPIDVIGDPDRRGDRSLDKPVHEYLAAASARGVVLVDADEQVVRLVDDNYRSSRQSADCVRDHQGCDALVAAGLGILVVALADKLDRIADARAERLGEFALAGSRRSIEQNVRPAGVVGVPPVGGRYDFCRQVTQFAQMSEVAPAQ